MCQSQDDSSWVDVVRRCMEMVTPLATALSAASLFVGGFYWAQTVLRAEVQAMIDKDTAESLGGSRLIVRCSSRCSACHLVLCRTALFLCASSDQ